MKLIRNNETGVLFVATDTLMKRVLRESAGPEKGKWSILEADGSRPKTVNPVSAPSEDPPAADDLPAGQSAADADGDGDGDAGEIVPGADKTDETLAELQRSLLASAAKAAKIADEKEAKRALAGIALENYAHKLDQRKSVDTLHDELVALIKGEDD